MKTGSADAKPEPGMNIPFLDVLRGIAAISVVCYHASESLLKNEPGLGGNILYHVAGFGYLGVEVFFVVSGYCILVAAVNGIERGKSVGDFAKARFRRIFPTYWLSLLVTVSIWGLTTVLARKGILPAAQNTGGMAGFLTLPVILANVTLTQLAARQVFVSVVAWTLCYEIAFYAICAALLLIAGGRKAAPVIVFRCVHALTTVVLLLQVGIPGKLGYPLDMWAMFGLGAGIAHLIWAERTAEAARLEARNWLLGLGILALGVILRAGSTTVSNHDHSAAIGFAVALAAAGGLWLVRNVSLRSCGIVGQWFAVVGGFSYSLYLIHYLFIGFADRIFRYLKMPATWHYVHFAIIVGVSLVAGFVFFLLAEKPFLRTRSRRAVEAGITPTAEVAP